MFCFVQMQNPKQYHRDIRSIAKMYEERERERRFSERRYPFKQDSYIERKLNSSKMTSLLNQDQKIECLWKENH
jgi:hypothetical protein